MALRPTKSAHVRSLGVILPTTYPTERAHKNFGVERIRTTKKLLMDGADRRLCGRSHHHHPNRAMATQMRKNWSMFYCNSPTRIDFDLVCSNVRLSIRA